MPTEADIRMRAMQEFQMALEVCQIRRQAIVEARTEALDAVPAGHAALDAYDEAVRAADEAFAADDASAQQDCQLAQIESHTKHGDANVVVMATLQEDNAAAEAACREAIDQCEQDYQAAWNEALQMVGPPADKARKAASAAREKGLAACEKARAKALAAADARYQKALVRNNDTMIAETDAASNAMVTAQQDARDRREKAIRAADLALVKALNADPAARAVNADYQARLQQDEQDAQAEKAAVWERMRADLAALATGGAA